MFQVSVIPHLRQMRPGEERAVLALVMRVFEEFVAPDFCEEGVAEFASAARSFVFDRPKGHDIIVAESRGQLLGMVDVRDGSHVSLFFVEAAYQRQGIGARLLDSALDRYPFAHAVTVNSGPSAVPAYVALGFVPTGPEAEAKGIRFVPMQKQLRAVERDS